MGPDGLTSTSRSTRIATRNPLHFVLLTASVVAIAWGALAFGAVYPWAYTPLAVSGGAIGLLILVLERRGRPRLGPLMACMAFVGIGMALQIVPLASTTLDRVSPATRTFLNRYAVSYGVIRSTDVNDATPAAEDARHAVSVTPRRTLVGLALFLALAVFCLGMTRLLSATGASVMVSPLIAFGVFLALVGIGQFTLTAHEEHPLIYGFWKPQFTSRPFGPFVNPNHFAGWMLMALPLALALFYEALQRTIEAAARTHNKWSVVSLPEFGRAMTFGFSSVVMGLSLAMTRSRSGVGALAAGSLVALWIMVRRQRSAKARAVVVVAFLVVVGGVGAWAGLDTLVDKALTEDRTSDSLGGRLGAWNDTLQIIQDFPLTGTGFNTYGTAMTIYQSGRRDVHFQEAHNDYLQIAAEGGLLIGLPVLAMIGMFVRDVRRRFLEAPKEGTTYWLRVGAVIGLVSIGLQSMVEFSLQMPGNAALFAVLAAIALHQSPNLRERRSSQS